MNNMAPIQMSFENPYCAIRIDKSQLLAIFTQEPKNHRHRHIHILSSNIILHPTNSFFSHTNLMPLIRPSLTIQVGVSRELLKLIIIDLGQLRTTQRTQTRRCLTRKPLHGTGNTIQYSTTLNDIRRRLHGKLHREAGEVVAFGQTPAVVDAASEVLGVDAREGVGCASIAADVEELGVFGGSKQGVGL